MHSPRRTNRKTDVGRAPARRFLFQAAMIFLLGQGPTYAQNQNDYLASFDADGDKRVSLSEFQRAMSWAFEQMGKNGDGILTAKGKLGPESKKVYP